MAQYAFSEFFCTGFGNAFVAICLLFFAFSTILSWNLFARLNVEYLFGSLDGRDISGRYAAKLRVTLTLFYKQVGNASDAAG